MGERMFDGGADRRPLRICPAVRLVIGLPFGLRWWMRLTLPIPTPSSPLGQTASNIPINPLAHGRGQYSQRQLLALRLLGPWLDTSWPRRP